MCETKELLSFGKYITSTYFVSRVVDNFVRDLKFEGNHELQLKSEDVESHNPHIVDNFKSGGGLTPETEASLTQPLHSLHLGFHVF